MSYLKFDSNQNIFSGFRFFFLYCLLFPVFIFSTGFLVQAMASEQSVPWGYEGGTGPLHWGEMEQDHDKHMMCREGIHQSPVDINEVLGFEQKDLNSHYFETPLQIINNGHTVLLRYTPGSYIEWGNEVFELIQFHFHHPSEHRINGKHFPMEVHFVHKAPDHEYVIIAVLVTIGNSNSSIQKLWNKIPRNIDQEKIHPDIRLSASDILPDSKSYFHYSGSLTTPPCSENVTWLILEKPIEFSRDQLEHFKKFIPQNARPIQKLHHRIIVKLK